MAEQGRTAAGAAGTIGAWMLRPLVLRYLRSGFDPLPTLLQLEISSHCNLRCVMCAKTIGATNVVPDRLMPMGIFSALKSVLPFVEYVDLSGIWGEAFIKPDLYLEMLAVLKTHGIFVRTISNGTLIDGETAREIVRLGLDLLTVSVDAARPETYRRIRRRGELSTLVAAVRRIGEEKKRQGRSAPRIEFMALGMRDTIEELPELVRLAGDLGVSRVGLQQMAEYRGMEGQSVAWRHREMGRKWSDAARTVAGEVGVEFSLIPPDQFEAPQEMETFKDLRGAPRTYALKDCFLPWKMAVVTAGGDVIPCCAMFDSMGSLRTQSFKEIWNGERFRELRRRLIAGTPPAACIACSARGWRKPDPPAELRMVRELLFLPLRRTLRRIPFLGRAKSALKNRLGKA